MSDRLVLVSADDPARWAEETVSLPADVMAGLASLARRARATPATLAGPFYRDDVPELAPGSDLSRDGVGEPLHVSLRVTDLDGYKRILDRKVDAVAVESPPYFHPEQAVAVLQAGKHLYLAKPIAVDVAGCVAIERAARAAGPSRHVLVDFHAEATSEKVAMGWYLDGRVTAVGYREPAAELYGPLTKTFTAGA